MLTIIEKVIFLQNVEVFAAIHTEQLSHLAAIAEEAAFSKGEVIYKHEDPSDALYIVLDGAVRLHRGEEDIAAVASKDAFGTWALFDDTPRVTTATAVEDTRVLRIYREDFLDILSDHAQIMEGVLKTLVGRLRGLLERVGVDIGQKPSS
jgi:CRP/FNR family transcriptional regulator